MKRFYLICLILISSYVQSQSVWQNPITTGERFHALHFYSPLLGWAAGDVGTLLNTTDGGITWTKQNLGSCENISRVQFVSPSEGWAIAGNTLYHSIDGGNSWTTFPVLSYVSITAFQFISPLQGWVRTEGGLLYTDDAGISWTLKNPTINSLFSFANPRKGWRITPFGGVKYTTDGGATWTNQVSGVFENILSINIIDSNEVWMAGVSGLIHTTNAGANWTINLSSRAAIGATLPFLTDCHFTDANTGWAISPIFESLISTTDGGVSWVVHSVKGELIYCSDSLNGIIAGDNLFTTNNAAASYTNALPTVTNESLNSIHFADLASGWSVGNNGTILHTANGGANWIDQSAITHSELYSVLAINPSEAWITGNMSDTLLHTVDAGLTWQVVSSTTTRSLSKVFFVNASVGWAVGDSGAIIKTVNGGNSWTALISNVTQKLNSVYFVNPNEGWAVGDGGIIIKTIDGGQTWNVQSIAFLDALNDVQFISPLKGWVVGESSMILYTNDGGQTWNQQVINISGDVFEFNAVVFTDSFTGYVTGFAPSIFKTTDGGNTWNPDECAPYNRVIKSICHIDLNHIWMAGENGSILFDSGINSTVSLNEHQAVLENSIHVYPNPITADAVLELNQELNQATLFIYNHLGQLIISQQELNGKKAQFNCNNIPNGFYFLQIKNADGKLFSTKIIIAH